VRTLRVQDGLLRSPPLRWALCGVSECGEKLTVKALPVEYCPGTRPGI